MSLPRSRPFLSVPTQKMLTRRLVLISLKRYLLFVILLFATSPGCENKTSPPDPSSGKTDVAFNEVTEQTGLGDFLHETGATGKKWMPETLGSGAGFIDYDSDGWQDIVLVAGGTWDENTTSPPALQLYRNNQDGSFSNRTVLAGLGEVRSYGFGVAIADYDNDHDPDIYLTTLDKNLLLRNDEGRFVEVGEEANVAGASTWSTAALFFDADRDGWLDLYVGNYVPWTPETDKWCTSDGESKDYCTPHQYEGVPGFYFHNNGDGTFTDKTEEVGFVNSPGKTLGVASIDFDKDGWLDVVVANDKERNLLYHNNGDGTFTEKGVVSGVAFDKNGRSRAGMGVDVALLGSDGSPTVAVGNFSEEMVGLFKYMGNGIFRDYAPASQVGMPSYLSLTFGVFFFDVDLDSDFDLFLANGHIVENIERIQPGLTYRQHAQLFLNSGNNTFDLADEIGGTAFEQKLVGRGAAYADYDNDGDLDILISENGGPVRLWRNELNPAGVDSLHYLKVHLEGDVSNTSAIGAWVSIHAGGHVQEQWVRTAGSYLSQSELPLTFGLGMSPRVDTLFIQWPSGEVERFESLLANQVLHIVEGQTALEQQ